MTIFLLSLILEASGLGLVAEPQDPTPQNVCCVLPDGQQCCSPGSDGRGLPTGCGC